MAEPSDVELSYRAWAGEQGRTGDAAELVCRPLAEGLDLCFTWVRDGRRVHVTRADLARWGVGLEAVEAAARARSEAALTSERLERQSVEGVAGEYRVSARGDGLDAAALLHPDRLQGLLGGSPLVAVPTDDALICWLPGSLELDKIVAVGVRKMVAVSDHPVSALVYRWDGEAWVVWGEAVPKGM